jgi:glucose-6-phosphate isomerase
LIHQGRAPIALEFIGYAASQLDHDFVQEGTTSQQKLLANLLAQVIALATGLNSDNPNRQFFGNRPSFLLFGKKLTAKTLGALLAFYEHKVAFQGFIWNINSFDQEGVQLGKVLAGRILDRFNNQNSFPLADAFIHTLEL